MATKRLCSIPNCGKPHFSHGYCQAHRRRHRLYGDPLLGKTRSSKITRHYQVQVLGSATDDCVIWPFGRLKNGYAIMWREGRSFLVSRAVCIDLYGPPPEEDREAAHSCNNGHLACVNPRHLRWATPDENREDAARHREASLAEFGYARRRRARTPTPMSLRIVSDQRPAKAIAAEYNVSVRYVYQLRYKARRAART